MGLFNQSRNLRLTLVRASLCRNGCAVRHPNIMPDFPGGYVRRVRHGERRKSFQALNRETPEYIGADHSVKAAVRFARIQPENRTHQVAPVWIWLAILIKL